MTPETCPERANHGNPFRYCPVKGCGWMEEPTPPTVDEINELYARANAAAARSRLNAGVTFVEADGADLIAHERRRQIEQEGWSPEHDAEHSDAQLTDAARSYIDQASYQARYPDAEFDPSLTLQVKNVHGEVTSSWPWDDHYWKPSPDPVRNLVKAGALIAAEIDRLQARKDKA